MGLSILQAGDPLPDATLYEGTPDNKVNIKEVFGNKTGILFGVPGAFTPGCSKVSGRIWSFKFALKLGVVGAPLLME